MQPERFWWRALVALVVTVALASCGGGGESDRVADGGDDAEGSVAERSADTSAGGTAPGDRPEGQPVSALGGSPLVSSGRRFISTAELTIAVDEVSTTAERAVALVERQGGALFGESSTYEGEPRAVLTLKLPPDRFGRALRELGELGRVLHQGVDTEDVTERVVDLESRIATADDSVGRLRGFLGGAGSVADVAALEAELVARETELESLRAQLRTLEDQIDLATIVLTIVHDDGDQTPPAEPDEDDDLPGFLDALGGSWDAMQVVGSVGLAVLGAALPWLPVLVLVWVAGRWRRRGARRGSMDPPPARTSAGPPAPAAG